MAAGAGVAAMVLFVRRRRRLPDPLIDVQLFHRSAFAGAVAVNLATFALSGLLFFVSQYLQLVRGDGPLEAGARQLPITAARIAAAGLVGILAARIGHGRLIGAAMLDTAGGLVLLAFAEGVTTYRWLAAAFATIGLGIGLALALTADTVVSAVPPDRAGAASAVSETAYELGIALGIVILGSLHTLLYRAELAPSTTESNPVPDAARSSLAAVVDMAGTLPSAQAQQTLLLAKTAFVDAMQVTTGVMAAVLALAALVAGRMIPNPTSTPLEQ